MSEFLQADFGKLAERFGGLNEAGFTKATGHAEKLDQINKENIAVREWNDFITKSGLINKGALGAINQSEVQKLNAQNENLKDVKGVVTLDQQMNEIQNQLQKLAKEILLNIPELMSSMKVVVAALQKSVEGWELIFKAFRGGGSKFMRLLGFGGGGSGK